MSKPHLPPTIQQKIAGIKGAINPSIEIKLLEVAKGADRKHPNGACVQIEDDHIHITAASNDEVAQVSLALARNKIKNHVISEPNISGGITLSINVPKESYPQIEAAYQAQQHGVSAVVHKMAAQAAKFHKSASDATKER